MSEEIDDIQSAMRQANELASIVTKVGESVLLLCEKRVTLEEKMLRTYLHELAICCAGLAAKLHAFTASGAKSESVPFSEIARLTSETNGALDELLKVIRYNLNFLEQYFEHDFYDKLVNEYKFLERFSAVKRTVEEPTTR